MTSHDEALVLQLLGDVTRAGTRDFDPRLREDGTGTEHVGNVHGGVDGVEEGIAEVKRRRHVVNQARDSGELSRSILRFPDTEHADQEVLGEAGVEHLTDEEDVGGESGLQHDGHVGGIEEADGVGATSTTLARGLDGNLDTEALEVDDGGEDGEGG